MRKILIQGLKFLAYLAVGLLLLWLAFRNVDLNSLSEGLKQANYSWIILSLLCGLAAFLSRARRWMILVQPLGYKPSLWHTFHALMSGYLANLALPRVGEITRCVALGRKENIPVDKLFGTVVVERTIDFFSLLLIMFVMIISSGEKIKQFFKVTVMDPLQQKVFSLSGFTWILSGAILILAAVSLFFLIKYRHDLKRIRFFSKLFEIARGMIDGLKTITGLERKWEFVIHTLFIWICYTLMTWVVVYAIDSTSHLNLGDAVFLLVIGGLAMTVPVPSGIGAFHYIISRGLAFVQGVRLEDGALYAILTHESQLILIIIIGTISFFIMFGKHKTEDPSANA